MNQKRLLVLLLPILVGVVVPVHATARIIIPAQVLAGSPVTIELTNLNSSSHYIVVFSNHPSPPANYSFTASGYSHEFVRTIAEDPDGSLQADLYAYNLTSGLATGSSLATTLITLLDKTDYAVTCNRLTDFWWLIPIVIIAVFIRLFLRVVVKK